MLNAFRLLKDIVPVLLYNIYEHKLGQIQVTLTCIFNLNAFKLRY